jgi:hypothetical protein
MKLIIAIPFDESRAPSEKKSLVKNYQCQLAGLAFRKGDLQLLERTVRRSTQILIVNQRKHTL